MSPFEAKIRGQTLGPWGDLEKLDISTHQVAGGNSNIFGIFTPKLGEDPQFDEQIFEMGW